MTKTDLLDLIDKDSVIGFAQELVRIPTENPPGNEKAAALLVLERFKTLGLETRIIEAEKGRPNIIAWMGDETRGSTLLLNGHTDVVPAGPDWEVDPYGGLITDGRLYGRGACDMKGGIAAIIAVAEVFKNASIKPAGKLLYSVVVGEETGGAKGTGYLVEQGHLRADLAIVAEPSDFRMSISEGGVLWTQLVTRGTQTHTINRETAVNAVEKMASVITALQALGRELGEIEHKTHGSPILSINEVNGGVKMNIVPDVCRASMDLRFPPGIGMMPQDAIDRIEAVLDEMRMADPELEVETSYQVVAYPFEQSEDIALVGLVKEATRAVTGSYPEWWRRGKKTVIPTDDSDVYHLWTKGHIPSMYFGPGKLEQCHIANEYIDVEDIYTAAKIYTMLALNVLTTLP